MGFGYNGSFGESISGTPGEGGSGTTLPGGDTPGSSLIGDGDGNLSWAEHLLLSGGVLSGQVEQELPPTAPEHLANKEYVDDSDADLLLAANSNAQGYANDAETDANEYTDSAVADYLPLTGGTLTGALISSGTPTTDLELANKKYVDDNAGGGGSSLPTTGLDRQILVQDGDASGDGVWAPMTITADGDVFPTGNIINSLGKVVNFSNITGLGYAAAQFGDGTVQEGVVQALTIIPPSNVPIPYTLKLPGALPTEGQVLAVTDLGSDNWEGTWVDLPAPTPGGDATVYPETPKFILSLESGVPYQRLANITSTSIYVVPKNGNTATVYNGTAWIKLSSAEVAIPLSGKTANANFDVFAYNNSGTLAFETLEWPSDTARATAVVPFHGLYVKAGDNTRLYLGSFRTTATGTTERKAIVSTAGTENAKLLLYNAYNQEELAASIKITASNWSTSSSTWRVINSSANYRSLFLIGLPTKISGQYTTFAVSASSSVTFGIDAATPHAQAVAGSTQSNGNGVTIIGAIETEVSAGFHSLNALEAQFVGGSGTFYASGFNSGIYESLIRLKLKS